MDENRTGAIHGNNLSSAKLSISMKAIILDQPEHFHLADIDLPPHLGQDEALVHILRVGICGTDLRTFEDNLYSYRDWAVGR